jgi:hypothetical protein
MEEYTCHAGGVVHVTIHDLQSGYSRQYHLGRWSSSASPITPGKRKRAAKR